MKRSRDIIGLPVVDLKEGKSLGRVQQLIVNPLTRKVDALEVGERAFLQTKTEVILYEKIQSIGNDVVTVLELEAVEQNRQSPKREQPLKRQLIGTHVITIDGTLAGNVGDYSFNPHDGMLAEIFLITEKPRSYIAFPISMVERFGQDFIIVKANYTDEVKQVKSPPTENTPKQILHSVESRAIDFTLGRQVGSDVTDDHNEIILRKGETVTAETIEQARQKGKLSQLLLAAGVGELLDGIDFTREKLDAGSKKLLDAWHTLRERSHVWFQHKMDDDRPSPAVELRDLWNKLQGTLVHGGRDMENITKDKIKSYIVGKTLSQPVYDQEGTLIGARGDTATEEMRDIAENAGRLSQLFLSAAAHDVQTALDPIKKQIEDILGKKRAP